MQRNNIATRYGRARQYQLVRWREIDGLMPGEIRERAAAEWPDLPAIHSRTWRAWSRSRDYAELRATVCGEERKREALTDLFAAAGSADALSDVADAASYALAAKAMEMADDAESAKEVRTLMATVRDGKAMAVERVREEYEAQLEAVKREHAAQCAEYEAAIAKVSANLARLNAVLERKSETVDADERRKIISAVDEFVGGPQH